MPVMARLVRAVGMACSAQLTLGLTIYRDRGFCRPTGSPYPMSNPQ